MKLLLDRVSLNGVVNGTRGMVDGDCTMKDISFMSKVGFKHAFLRAQKLWTKTFEPVFLRGGFVSHHFSDTC